MKVETLNVRELKILNFLKKRKSVFLVDISRSLQIPPSTVYGILMKMQLVGLVKKTGKTYSLTKEGEELLANVLKYINEVEQV